MIPRGWAAAPQGWEARMLRRIASRPLVHPGAVKAVTALGSRPVAYTVTTACAVASARRTRVPVAAAAARHVGILAAEDCARTLLCRAIDRPRPPVELRHSHFTGASLPSRHATLATLTAGAVIDASRPGVRRATAGGALATCTAVGVTRLRLGVHWPTDVAAGFLFAAAWRLLFRGLPVIPHSSLRRSFRRGPIAAQGPPSPL